MLLMKQDDHGQVFSCLRCFIELKTISSCKAWKLGVSKILYYSFVRFLGLAFLCSGLPLALYLLNHRQTLGTLWSARV